jgi:quaternary ammonium compound-resistance protein SugE
MTLQETLPSTTLDDSHRRAWIFLLIASVFEVVFALSNNANEGFTQLGPSLLTVLAASGGIFTLSLALKTLDVSIGYTVWAGIGSIGTVVFGSLLFQQDITLLKLACFVMIIAGSLGLKLAPTAEATDEEAV